MIYGRRIASLFVKVSKNVIKIIFNYTECMPETDGSSETADSWSSIAL